MCTALRRLCCPLAPLLVLGTSVTATAQERGIYAQTPPSSARAPDSSVEPEAPPAVPHDPRLTDADVDHVILMPTAETQPAGTWYFSSYDVLFLQAGYAFTDRAQFTLSIVPYFSKDTLIPLDLTVKGVVARTDRVRVAALGSITGFLGYQNTEALVGRAGGVVQLCFDDACRSSISTASQLIVAGSVLIANGVGAVIRTNKLVSFLLELDTVLPLARSVAQVHGLAGGAGVRLSGRSWGVDLALGAPLDLRSSVPVVPWVGFTYRFLR